MALSLAVLAGGFSKRMGQDKGLVSFLGKPLILQVIERLSALSDDILVISNDPQAYAFLNKPVFPDIQPGLGPLGGIQTAMKNARHPLVAVVGCDMPFASQALFQAEQNLLEEKKSLDLVIPSTPDGLEPLHATYRIARCLPAIEASINEENYKIIDWFDKVKVHIMDAKETNIHADTHTFVNLNTRSELTRAELFSRKGSK